MGNTFRTGKLMNGLYVDDNGNVGIGTTTPSYKLDIQSGSVGAFGSTVTAAWSSGFLNHSYFMAPNMTGGGLSIAFGKSNGTYNVAKIVYNHVGNASSSNYIGLGFWDADNILNVRATGNVGIGTIAPTTKLSLGGYTGSRLPYINGTGTTYNENGITIGSSNSGNANIGGGLDLTNNTYSVGAYSPVISFSSISSSGTYNNGYAGIWGVLAGTGADANWNVGHLAFGTTSGAGISERLRITNAGNVGIGITSPSNTLHVYGTMCVQGAGQYGLIKGYDDPYHGIIMRGYPTNNGNMDITATDCFSAYEYGGDFRFYQKNSGVLSMQVRFLTGTIYASSTSIQSISDIRTKENIRNSQEGLNIITSLRTVRFDFKDGYNEGKKNQLGFIAQEVEEVFPDAVSEWQKEDGQVYKTIGPSALIPVIVKSIQELKAEKDLEIAQLKAEIEILKNK